MKELKGDLWTSDHEYKIITTNGVVRNDGSLVMGKGVALEAALRFPEIPKILGEYVKTFGNVPMIFNNYKIITFPTKNHWIDKSDIKLIERSAVQIYNLLPRETTAAMTRPGCGNGGLKWDEVKPRIESILDDRFFVYSK